MSDECLIGLADQLLFQIENTRERADRLSAQLVPKICEILDDTCKSLVEIYGEDALDSLRIPTTPAHRPEGKNTKRYDFATAGLAVKGQFWLFQMRFNCTADEIYVILFGIRGLESNPLVEVMRRHKEAVLRLFEEGNFDLNSTTVEASDGGETVGLNEFIDKLNISAEKAWNSTSITGSSLALPIKDLDTAWDVIFDFISLFPIFRAAADSLLGKEDSFARHAARYWAWLDHNPTNVKNAKNLASLQPGVTPNDGDSSAWEGGFQVAIRRRRRREKRLRARKIRETMSRFGRLSCEVPGCGFDFFSAYGEIGREFAHVHHTNRLSLRSESSITKLSDLVIVCANCHAMIHRGGQCRNLEEIRPQPNL